MRKIYYIILVAIFIFTACGNRIPVGETTDTKKLILNFSCPQDTKLEIKSRIDITALFYCLDVNNKRHGMYKSYNQKTWVLQTKGKYTHGIRTGRWTTFDESGGVLYTVKYNELGQKHGWLEVIEDGTTKIKEFYQYDKREQYSYYYNNEGLLDRVVHFVNGRPFKSWSIFYRPFGKSYIITYIYDYNKKGILRPHEVKLTPFKKLRFEELPFEFN